MTDLSQQSDEFAELHYKYILAKLPVDLSDLAHYVVEHGESLEQLDGSPESLDALSAMMLRWIGGGLTDIPVGLPLSPDEGDVTLAGDDEDSLWSRSRLLMPWLFAYVLETLKLNDPGAEPSIFTETRGKRIVDGRLNSVGIRLSDGAWLTPVLMHAFVFVNVKKRPQAGDVTMLRRKIENETQTLQMVRVASDLLSLASFASAAPIPLDDARRFPPSVPPTSEAEMEATGKKPSAEPFLGDDVYLIARGRADGLDDPSAFRPLSLADVTTWLASLGAPASGLAEALAAASDEFETSMGELVVLQLALAKGSVRAIFIERADATDDEWIGFCTGAKKFAKSVRARFGTEDEWPE
ncbi:MAG: hypothetical protein ACOH1T_00030 [Microbacteriaceae bacterium]